MNLKKIRFIRFIQRISINFFISTPFTYSFKEKCKIHIKWFLSRFLKKNFFITERYRDKFSNNLKNFIIDESDNVAILIRGPIIEKEDFTLNTIYLYRKYYPNAPIYISTWDNEKYKLKNLLQDNKTKIISSKFEKPAIGYGSTNLQIKGNIQALDVIKKDKIKYTLTSRSDQRFYACNSLKFLKLFLKKFSYKKLNELDQQNLRLIALNFNTFMYRLYGLNDMFLFGLTEDVYNYWNTSKDTRKTLNNKSKKYTMLTYSKDRINEVYFMSEFLNRNGHFLKWNLEDYWKVLSERFIIVDSSSLDFFWPKYTFKEERWKEYGKEIQFREISFADWLLIKENKLQINEDIINKPIN